MCVSGRNSPWVVILNKVAIEKVLSDKDLKEEREVARWLLGGIFSDSRDSQYKGPRSVPTIPRTARILQALSLVIQERKMELEGEEAQVSCCFDAYSVPFSPHLLLFPVYVARSRAAGFQLKCTGKPPKVIVQM